MLARRYMAVTVTTLGMLLVLAPWMIVSGQPAPAQPPAQPAPAQPGTNQPAQPKPAADVAKEAENLITPEGKEAITKGLKYLAEAQSENGSYGARMGGQNFVVATTALTGLAFVAGGNLPERGPYASNVEKIINYLLDEKVQGDTGFISGNGDQSRTHGHGYATLFLAQCLGMTSKPELQQKIRRGLVKAVKVIQDSQTAEGGWGYEPSDKTWDEGSTTICMVQGLRAARDAGITVDKKVIDNAVRYVHRCAMRVDWTDTEGKNHVGYTFKYSLSHSTSRSTFPLTAAAVSVLHGSGKYEGEVLQGGIDWLDAYYHEYMDSKPNEQWYQRFFYYSHFYAAQAFYHAPNERYWKAYFPKIRDYIIKQQNKQNGSWPSPYGESYGSPIAVMILQIPYGYLPIFQK